MFIYWETQTGNFLPRMGQDYADGADAEMGMGRKHTAGPLDCEGGVAASLSGRAGSAGSYLWGHFSQGIGLRPQPLG
jgi:hypothetical protein